MGERVSVFLLNWRTVGVCVRVCVCVCGCKGPGFSPAGWFESIALESAEIAASHTHTHTHTHTDTEGWLTGAENMNKNADFWNKANGSGREGAKERKKRGDTQKERTEGTTAQPRLQTHFCLVVRGGQFQYCYIQNAVYCTPCIRVCTGEGGRCVR